VFFTMPVIVSTAVALAMGRFEYLTVPADCCCHVSSSRFAMALTPEFYFIRQTRGEA
jgi:hypothetical protein